MKHKIKQISPNIFKVTKYEKNLLPRESIFVQDYTEDFNANDNSVFVKENNGSINFFLNGKQILSEIASSYTVSFSIKESDKIYGLGIHQGKPFNRRNNVFQMLQINAKTTAVPFLVSTGGYALLFDTCAYMSIGIDKICTDRYSADFETDVLTPDQIHIYADDSEIFTYYVILSDTIDGQIDGYRKLTGKCSMLPKWAYGFFQSREHYKTQEEILNIAREFRKRDIPIDCIVQDWNYWGDLGWNALDWDKNKYPDPKAMIDEIHKLNMKFMISVWPSFGPGTAICKELEKCGGILEKKDRSGENWGRVHDPLNQKGLDKIWEYMYRNLFSAGVDGWWLDSTEPALDSDNSINLLECSPCVKGSNSRYLNCYGLNCCRNVYRNQRKTTNDKRVYILTRSGYAGIQAYGSSNWTGDIKADWTVFKNQISALLSCGMSGIPYSTTDIGAFFAEYENGIENQEYRELYTRWFWFGAFSPLFRSHGTGVPREMWFFGESGTEYYDSQLRADKLRYKLMPYIYSYAFKVYSENKTLMRALVMDYASDENVHSICDSYMFGDSLLIKAITDYKCRSSDVYLPKGNQWIDFFTGERYDGGNTVSVDAPISQIPVFVKAGSIIPICECENSTALQDESRIKLYVYSGSDCETFYYRDEGDNYSYENGNYIKIPLYWKENENKLILDCPSGNADGFDVSTTFEFYLNNDYISSADYKGVRTEIFLNK